MTPSSRPQHFHRIVFALALSIGISFGAILYGTSVMLTSHAAGSAYSLPLLSTAFSGSVVTGGLMAVPVGRSADRRGVRGIIGAGGVLVFAGFLVFAGSAQPWQVVAAWWLLIGPGSAMVLFDPAFIALQQWFGREDRNRAAGTLTVITGLAGPIFVPAVTSIVDLGGWRVAAVLLGTTVCAVTTAAAAWALRVAPKPPAGQSAAHTADQTTRSSSNSQPFTLPPGFILITTAVALTMAVLEASTVHRIARFEAVGFETAALGWWAAAVGLLSLPGRYVVPFLARRWDGAGIWAALTALLIPALVLAIRGTHTWEMNGHFIVFGLLFGAFMPLRAVVMSDWYSGPRFGYLMGIQSIALAAGRAAGPALLGWVADTSAGYPGGMALLTLALLTVLPLLIAARIRRRQVD